MIKQRTESIAQFQAGSRADLVAKENAELALLQAYLPAQLDDAELDALISEAIAATGAACIKDMGKVMGVIKSKAQGRADMGAVGARSSRRTPERPICPRRRPMAGRIPQAFIDELIARADIVEIIGARVPLKKAGREYKACCPFHNEKTALVLGQPRQAVLSLLRLRRARHRARLPDGVRPAGVPRGGRGARQRAWTRACRTRRGAPRPTPERADDDRCTSCWRSVADFFERALRTTSARARATLAQRGLDAPTRIERFAIGYAPRFLERPAAALRRADEERRQRAGRRGLIIERERGQAPRSGERFYDRFRDRLMFPIRDSRGRVIGFGGRVIDQGEPKYLNSPETALFHKGKRALRPVRGAAGARATSSGCWSSRATWTWCACIRPASPTPSRRSAPRPPPEHLHSASSAWSASSCSAFDGDRAGRAAAWRALQNALPEAREGREIRFLFLPEGQDPDTLVGEEGAKPSRRAWTSACRCPNTWCGSCSSRRMISHADGRRASPQPRGRCSTNARRVCTGSCCSSASPQAIGLPATRLQAAVRRAQPARAGSPRRAAAARSRHRPAHGAQRRARAAW